MIVSRRVKSAVARFCGTSKHSRFYCIDLPSRFRCEHDGEDSHHAHANHENRDRSCTRIGSNQCSRDQRNGATCNRSEFARASHAGVAKVGWKELGKECRLAACQSGVDATAQERDAKPNGPSAPAIHHPEVGDHHHGGGERAATAVHGARRPTRSGQRSKDRNRKSPAPLRQVTRRSNQRRLYNHVA